MLKRLLPIVGLLCLFAQPAFASGHTSVAREITLVSLQIEVDQGCGRLKTFFSSHCREMKSLVADLYRNPNVATKADLAILDRLTKLGLQTAGAKTSLAQAIEETVVAYTHVIDNHEGVWRDDNCRSPAQS